MVAVTGGGDNLDSDATGAMNLSGCVVFLSGWVVAAVVMNGSYYQELLKDPL